MLMAKHRGLNEIAKRSVEEFQRREAMMFLECAINLLCTNMALEEVAQHLRDHAELLEEWG